MKKVILMMFLCFSFSLLWAEERNLEGFKFYKVMPNDTLSKIAPEYQWDLIMRVNRIDLNHLPLGKNILIPKNIEGPLPYFCPVPEFIDNDKPRAVFVFLDSQYFGAYEYGELCFWGPVCTGREGHETPEGTFQVLWKAEEWFSRKYDNAPMPFSLCFSNIGYFIHEQALTGKPSSHGCVRLLRRDARKLFYWAKRGDKIIITKAFV